MGRYQIVVIGIWMTLVASSEVDLRGSQEFVMFGIGPGFAAHGLISPSHEAVVGLFDRGETQVGYDPKFGSEAKFP
jgi:hypothetical protein